MWIARLRDECLSSYSIIETGLDKKAARLLTFRFCMALIRQRSHDEKSSLSRHVRFLLVLRNKKRWVTKFLKQGLEGKRARVQRRSFSWAIPLPVQVDIGLVTWMGGEIYWMWICKCSLHCDTSVNAARVSQVSLVPSRERSIPKPWLPTRASLVAPAESLKQWSASRFVGIPVGLPVTGSW
jgi:hypothetical protein